LLIQEEEEEEEEEEVVNKRALEEDIFEGIPIVTEKAKKQKKDVEKEKKQNGSEKEKKEDGKPSWPTKLKKSKK
jgi:hypothetical protein